MSGKGTPVDATGISLNKTEETVELGESVALYADIFPSNATYRDITWTSSDDSIASVEEGVVSTKGVGTATITATCTKTPSVSTTFIVTVKIAPKTINISQTSASVYENATLQLTVNVGPDDVTDNSVKWYTDDPKIATVDSTGMVKGISEGKTTIRVRTNDGGLEAVCELTVKIPVVTPPAKTKVSKVPTKKLSAKKLKVKFKKVKDAKGYEVWVVTKKKAKKALVKKFTKKPTITLKSKKLKNKKKLFVKVRAYKLDGKDKVFGKWSKAKKVRVKG